MLAFKKKNQYIKYLYKRENQLSCQPHTVMKTGKNAEVCCEKSCTKIEMGLCMVPGSL